MRSTAYRFMATNFLILAVASSLLMPSNSFAQKYSFTNLGTLSNSGFGQGNAEAFSINALGQIVGYSSAPDGNNHAFLWQNGVMTDLGTLSDINSQASCINDAGQVVGRSQLPGGSVDAGTATYLAFIWQNGVMSGLGNLGGATSEANGINNAGLVVGSSFIPNGTIENGGFRAFTWQNGVMSRIVDVPWGSWANAINAAGLIVGFYAPTQEAERGFVWQNGSLTDLGDLGGGICIPYAINTAGQIVGGSTLPKGDTDVFMWSKGAITDLGFLGTAYGINNAGQIVGGGFSDYGAFLWQNGVITSLGQFVPPISGLQLTNAYGINDAGQIVGTAQYGNNLRAFLLTPNPFANRQTVSVAHNMATAITLTAQDTETPPPTLTFAIKAEPTHGTLSAFNASTGAVTYTPISRFQGTDSFTFTASNGIDTSAPAPVTLIVAGGTPIANAQTVKVAHNVSKSLTLTGMDSDSPPLPLTFALKSEPAHGTLSGLNSATGAITYTPGANKSGTDSFTFTVSNGVNKSAPATVTLITAPGTPTAKAQSVPVAHNTAKVLTLTGSDPDSPALPITFAIRTEPAHGTVGGLNSSTGAIIYTPGDNKYGPDSFSFTISNGTNTSAPATVTLDIAPGVPTANAQTVAVAHGIPILIRLNGSDLDSPSLPLTFALESQPTHGSLSGFNAATGICIYSPNSNYHGADEFTFTVNNGTNVSAPGKVTLIVAVGVPTSGSQLLNITENRQTTITLTGSDSDTPALPLTFAIAASPAHGTLGALNTTTGKVTYTPNVNFVGLDSFTYTVSNGTNKSTPGKITLNVSSGG